MLKLEFLEDYKIFKKGQTIKFGAEKFHTYTVIGFNESGKTIYLDILRYIFSKDEHLKIDRQMNCRLKYEVFSATNQAEIREIEIIKGEVQFNVDSDTLAIISSISDIMKSLKSILNNSNAVDLNIRHYKDIEQVDIYSLLRKYSLHDNYFTDYFLIELNNVIVGNRLKNRANNSLISRASVDNRLKNIRELESKLKKDEILKIVDLGLELKNIKMDNEFETIKLNEFSSLDKMLEEFNGNLLMESLLIFLESPLNKYYSPDRGVANEGHDEIKSELVELYEKFNYFYPNRSKTELFYTTGKFSDITLTENGKYIPFKNKSAGMQFWMNIFFSLLELNLDKENNINNIIIMDEPGYTLHLEAQEKFVEYLESISVKNIVIWSTHSPALINRDQNINIFERESEEIKIVKAFSNSFTEDRYLFNTLNILTKNTNYSLINVNDRKIILVEGMSDFLIFQKYFLNKKIMDKVYIVPIGGIQHFSHFLPFFLNDYYGKLYVIHDKDKGKKESQKAVEELGEILEDDKIVSIEDNLESLYGTLSKEEKKLDKILLAKRIIQDEDRFRYVQKKLDEIKLIKSLELE